MKNDESNKDYILDISSEDNGQVQESAQKNFFPEENNLNDQLSQPPPNYQVTQPVFARENKKENYGGVIPKRSLSKRINRGLIFSLICMVIVLGLITFQGVRQNKEKAEIKKIISAVHPTTEKWMFPSKENSGKASFDKKIDPEKTEEEQETSQEGSAIMKAVKADIDILDDLFLGEISKKEILDTLVASYRVGALLEENVYYENLEMINQKKERVDLNQDYAVCQIIREYGVDQINFETGKKTRTNRVYYFEYRFYKDKKGEWKVDMFSLPEREESMNQGNWEVGY